MNLNWFFFLIFVNFIFFNNKILYNYIGEIMKKVGYCWDCNLEFEYELRTKNDLKNVRCPKCNNNINPNSKKQTELTKIDKVVGNIFNTIINIYFYFYFITSLISLIFYFAKLYKLFSVVTIIIIIGIIIDYIFGYTRNLFGILGLILSSIVAVYLIKDIKMGIFLGIAVCTFISSFIKILLNRLIRRLFRKYG